MPFSSISPTSQQANTTQRTRNRVYSDASTQSTVHATDTTEQYTEEPEYTQSSWDGLDELTEQQRAHLAAYRAEFEHHYAEMESHRAVMQQMRERGEYHQKMLWFLFKMIMALLGGMVLSELVKAQRRDVGVW